MSRAVWPWALALGALACGSEPVVGGSCRAGLTECNAKCVDLINDRNHCGTCDTVCAADRTCFSGRCLTQDEIDELDSGKPRPDGGYAGSEHFDGGDEDSSSLPDVSADGGSGGAGGDSSVPPDVSADGTGAGGASGHDGGGGDSSGVGGDASVVGDGSAGGGGASGAGGSSGSDGSSGDGGSSGGGGFSGDGGSSGGGGFSGDGGSSGGGGSSASGGSNAPDGASGIGGSVDTDGSVSDDGSLGDASPDATETPDAGYPFDGSLDAPPVCQPPYDTPAFCGSCETSCGGGTPLCTLTDGGFACSPVCNPPEISCGGRCLDPMGSDEFNCGTCGHVCPTLICQVGRCVGAGFGHTVIIGMDYADPSTNERSAQMTILVDAVMLAPSSSTRVLSFTQWADPSIVARVPPDIAAGTLPRGHTATFTEAGSWETVPSKLDGSKFDVFLVYDQPNAQAEQLATTGTLWNRPIESFVKGGGVVIVLDGASGAAHMRELLGNSGLLPVIEEVPISSSLVVVSPGDAVSLYVESPLAAKPNTIGFRTVLGDDNPYTTVVMNAERTLPVVLHSAR